LPLLSMAGAAKCDKRQAQRKSSCPGLHGSEDNSSQLCLLLVDFLNLFVIAANR
jgi:hypothetical protein